ncbi:Nicotinamide riboside kinase [Ceratobasidium theobromae]|uniref:Nicotinamide riboside kinase n=1 Tax=Ceratobasidium theobromae TaxID=1582974 RepID=A0A5N5QWM6_9AGAM|nr:Nicotinamide riboside kinase [Ceratobasidium theobromae]
MSTHNPKVFIVGIGGATCSGKTTLAKHLRDILPNSFIIHQDPQELVPIHPVYNVQDWDDPPGAIDWPRLRASLKYVKEYGVLPESHHSHDHLNEQKEVPIPQDMIERLTIRFKETENQWSAKGYEVMWGLLDGFLLYWDKEVVDYLDLKIFMRVPEEVLRKRRHERHGYHTAVQSDPEGSLWRDPPHYWEQIVYPAYVRANEHLFEGEDVERGILKPDYAEEFILLSGEGCGDHQMEMSQMVEPHSVINWRSDINDDRGWGRDATCDYTHDVLLAMTLVIVPEVYKQVARIIHTTAVASRAVVRRAPMTIHRRMATDSLPRPPPTTNKSGSSFPLILGLLAVGAGGAYYVNQSSGGQDLKHGVKAEAQATAAYEQTRDAASAKTAELQKQAEDTKNRTTSKSAGLYDQSAVKLMDAKNEAQHVLDSGIRKTESAYNSLLGRAEVNMHDAEARARELRDNAEKKAKQTWWEWIGWGSKKVDETKKEAAANVTEAAGRIEKEASKRA